jgi:tetratricopeptide (TPR) repeat protein
MTSADLPVPSGSYESAAQGNPYVGPRPFRVSDAGRFFGRREQINEVRALWQAERVVVLYGPAAVGKTSLLHAGVIPAVSSANADVLPVGKIGPAHPPQPTTVSQRNAYTSMLASSWTPFGRPGVDGRTTVAEFMATRPQRQDAKGVSLPVLAAIDQFEELFTPLPARSTGPMRFLDELAAALRDNETLHLLLVVRDDHLATLEEYEDRLSPYPIAYVKVEPLSRSAAKEAISRPVASTRRRYDEGVADELVDRLRTVTYTDVYGESVELSRDHVEPITLQIVCAHLWATLPVDVEVITSEQLTLFGDPGDALVQFVEEAIREVSLESGRLEKSLREWLESTFITEHGTRGTAYRGIMATSDMPNEVADALVERHVLAAEQREGATWYTLSQDRLVTAVREANQAWRDEHDLVESKRPEFGPDTFLKAAEAALKMGKYATALRYAATAVKRYRVAGDDRRLAHSLALQGNIARTAGDLNAAEENFRAALFEFSVIDDQQATARMLSALADLHLSAGDFDTAEDLYRQATERYPANPETLVGLGYARWYGGSPADAEATFTQALALVPGEARALGGRGQVRLDLRDYGAALTDLGRALKGSLPGAEEIDTRSARALALAELGRGTEAEIELTAARQADPPRARTLLRAGRIAMLAGHADQARTDLQTALRASPPLTPREEAEARRLLDGLES